MIKKFPELPSFVWIILIVGGVAAFIIGIIAFFVGLGTIEGFGSLVILVITLVIIVISKPNPYTKSEKSSAFMKGVSVAFLALMAAAIDQTGNIVYNKPIEIIYCDQGTYLTRDSDVSNPLPGRTDITQDFKCIDNASGKTVKVIDPLLIFFIRFFEYVLYVYIVGFIINLKSKLLKKKTNN
jgi:hypothetical protein